jgi:hypothetical protein
MPGSVRFWRTRDLTKPLVPHKPDSDPYGWGLRWALDAHHDSQRRSCGTLDRTWQFVLVTLQAIGIILCLNLCYKNRM